MTYNHCMFTALTNHAIDKRPWGDFERFTLNEKTTVKIITVLPHQKLSLQTHQNRDEFWRIISGSGSVVIGDKTKSAKAGDSFFIERGQKHRALGGVETMQFLEIAFGEFDENDIVRLEDSYGRS